MNAANIVRIIAACALVDCAISRQNDVPRAFPSSAKNVHQSLAKRRTPCPNGDSVDVSAAKLTDCSQEYGEKFLAGPDAFDAAFCSDCGQFLYHYYVACNLDSSTTTGFLEVYCSTNENGDRCSSIVHNIQAAGVKAMCFDTLADDTCTSNCENALQASIEETGCCIYGLVAASFTAGVADDIWSTCNRQLPAACEIPFGKSAAIPVSVNALLLSFTIAIVPAGALL